MTCGKFMLGCREAQNLSEGGQLMIKKGFGGFHGIFKFIQIPGLFKFCCGGVELE